MFCYRLAQEQQSWIEMSVDSAFFIGRDLQKDKVVEMGRCMIGVGNYKLLQEFKKKEMSPYMQEEEDRGTPRIL